MVDMFLVYFGVMDIVFVLFFWRIIWKFIMNKKEKFGVFVVMSMGVFVGVIFIIKII